MSYTVWYYIVMRRVGNEAAHGVPSIPYADTMLPNQVEDIQAHIDRQQKPDKADIPEMILAIVSEHRERYRAGIAETQIYFGLQTFDTVLAIESAGSPWAPLRAESLSSGSGDSQALNIFKIAVHYELAQAGLSNDSITDNQMETAYAGFARFAAESLQNRWAHLEYMMTNFAHAVPIVTEEVDWRRSEHLQHYLAKLQTLGPRPHKRSRLLGRMAGTSGLRLTPEIYDQTVGQYNKRFRVLSASEVARAYLKSAMFHYEGAIFGEKEFTLAGEDTDDLEWLNQYQAMHDLDMTRPLTPSEWLHRMFDAWISNEVFGQGELASVIDNLIEASVADKSSNRHFKTSRDYRKKKYAHGYSGYEYGHGKPGNGPDTPPSESGVSDEGVGLKQREVRRVFMEAVSATRKPVGDYANLYNAFESELLSFDMSPERGPDRVTWEKDARQVASRIMRRIMIVSHPDVNPGDQDAELLHKLATDIRSRLIK